MKDNSIAAFPRTGNFVPNQDGLCPYDSETLDGMTLRQYYAAAALPALIIGFAKNNRATPDNCSARAFEYADAMLRAGEE